MPSELSPDPAGLAKRIRSGFVAEQKFGDACLEELTRIAQTECNVPTADLPTLVKRALTAVVNTVRSDVWKPELLGRMVRDQVLVATFKRGGITDEQLRRCRTVVERYVRKHLGRYCAGSLTIPQEEVSDETVDIFLTKVSQPDFVLTSKLDTYLIGIAVNQIKAFVRRQGSSLLSGPRANPVAENPANASTTDELPALIHFYYTAHRCVADQLSQLDTRCLTIILRYYGIDEARVDAVSETPEPSRLLTDAEFNALFSVALGPAETPRKLKDIAPDVGISPAKISDKHLDCVDRLVQTVVPDLLDTVDASLLADIRQDMQARLAEAQLRKQKKWAEKQRYATRHA